MAKASQFGPPVCPCLALSLQLYCKYRFDLPRCDPLNTLFVPEEGGERGRSPSARCLTKLIMCELLHKAAAPPPISLALFLSECVCHCTLRSSSTKLAKTSTSAGMCGWTQFFLVPAGSSSTFCKCLQARGNAIKHTANNWKGTVCESLLIVIWKKPLCDWKGLGVSTKGKMNCLCFPFCLFKYWNTKSFRREIILQGLQSKWDSLRENKFFQILGCEWVCVCVTSARPAGISSCEAAAATSVSMWAWWATWKYTEEARRSNWVFCKSGLCPV